MTAPLPKSTAEMVRAAAGRKAAGPSHPAPDYLQGAPIAQAAAAQEKLDNERFEKHAGELLLPTATRPALVTADEINELRAGYRTGANRLKVLETVTGIRLDFWMETNGGGPAIDPISGVDRAKCEKWFQANPPMLAKAAPPNPLKGDTAAAAHAAHQKELAEARRQAADKLIEQSKVTLPATGAAPAAPTTTPPTVQSAPAAAPLAAAQWPGTHVGIDYADSDGFTCRLVVYQGTQIAEISKLVKLGQAATAALKLAGAKPATVPGPAAATKAPICPVHHKPMKKSKKPGTWFCPVKDPDTDEYCDEKFTEAK